MKIGLIDQKNVLEERSSFRQLLERFFSRKATSRDDLAEIIQFEISTDNLSFNELLFSSFATPARYVMEIFLRFSSVSSSEESEECFIFNPFFRMSSYAIQKILPYLKKLSDCELIVILEDEYGVPIGYFFPKWIIRDDARYLSLLSGMDAKLDAIFLRSALLIPTEIITVKKVKLNKKSWNNGFHYNGRFENIYRWITESAVKTLYKQLGDRNLEALMPHILRELKITRDSIPFTAIMPYHAGDVLFLAIALKDGVSHVKKAMVSDWYLDILHECSPSIVPVPLVLTPMLRNGIAKPDEVLFGDIVALISEEDLGSSFYYYCRPSRDNWKTNFHLIDQFAFACGSTFIEKSELLSVRPIENHYLPEKVASPYKILFHLEGGWPLKRYPEGFQMAMIDLFYTKGYELTVLTSRAADSHRYKTIKYENLSRYRELLLSHHLIIGMDSFPVHYAAYVTGSPAICLYGNVKPSVSKAPLSNYYMFLSNGMECANCGSVDKCPINGKGVCDNFPGPEQVFITAEKMLNDLYAEKV